MNIAICDDNKKCLDELQTRVEEYFSTNEREAEECEIHTFNSGEDLLQSFNPDEFDIIFLDIDMPEITGMELAARIRQTDQKAQIIFVTYMEDQLPYGYRFKASGFVVKPYTKERIYSVLDDSITWIKAGNRQPIEVRLKGGGIAWLETRDIMYFESFRHYMVAVGKDNSRFEFIGKLSALENQLTAHGFVRLHRSYLVNLAYIFIRNGDSIRLTCGHELPIGRSYAAKFVSLYEKYRGEIG